MEKNVTEPQRTLAVQHADALETLLRDATLALLRGQADPSEATPILDRLVQLLIAAGRDPNAVVGQALDRIVAEEEVESHPSP